MQATLSSPRSWSGSPVFFLVAIFSAFAAVASRFAGTHRHFSNARVEYGLLHLPSAFFQIAIFAVGLGLAYRWYIRRDKQLPIPSSWLIGAIVLLFVAVWLPVTLHGGFAQDDWMLLSAASVRKILYAHPLSSLNTIDTVDGNYRPLGTILYVGYVLRWFGLRPLPFLLGNFLAGLACTLLVYAVMRELRLGAKTAAAGAILFLSRDLLYNPIAWMCALGDSLAIFGSGLAILLLLRALRSRGATAAGYHLAAWLCFGVALLAKQSAFAVPLIAALAVLLHPASEEPAGNWKKRIPVAVAVGAVYGATVLLVFRHAVNLLSHKTPYPITFSPLVLKVALSHITWFFAPIDFPDAHPSARLIVPALGLLILIAVVLWLRRAPHLLGSRPALMLFLVGAAFASLSLFLLLPSRSAAYYGSMSAFWMCMAVAIVLSHLNLGARASSTQLGTWSVCLLLLAGYSFVRLKETGLPPSGGYIWGTYSMNENMREFAFVRDTLHNAPGTQVLVVVGGPYSGKQQANMGVLADPSLHRILHFDPKSGFEANNRDGLLPQDNIENLRDVDAYHWTFPVDTARASAFLAGSPSLWIQMENGDFKMLSEQQIGRLEELHP